MDNHRSEKDFLKRTAKLEKELAAKTHELEIEAALEKVRTVAMRMNKPGDLPDVCKTLYKQFLLLGFSEMRNAMVNIHNDADKSFINYDYSDEIGKSTNHLTYNIHPLVEKQIKKIISFRGIRTMGSSIPRPSSIRRRCFPRFWRFSFLASGRARWCWAACCSQSAG